MMKNMFIAVFILTNFSLQFAYCDSGINIKETYRLANAYFRQGSLDLAEQEYKKIIEVYPKFAPVYKNLGVIASLDDLRLEEAVSYFKNALSLDPEDSASNGNLGMVYFRQKNLEEAAIYLEKAIELGSDNFKHFYILGWLYATNLNRPEDAIDLLKKSIELNKDYAQSYYALGIAYFALGKTEFILEQITNLRLMDQRELAEHLEDSIRTPYEKQSTEFVLPKKEEPPELIENKADGFYSESKGKGTMTGSARISIKLQGEESKEESAQ